MLQKKTYAFQYLYSDRFIITFDTRTRNYEDNIWDNNEGNNICTSIVQVV